MREETDWTSYTLKLLLMGDNWETGVWGSVGTLQSRAGRVVGTLGSIIGVD